MPGKRTTRPPSLRLSIVVGAVAICAIVSFLIALALTRLDFLSAVLSAVVAAILAFVPSLVLARRVIAPLDVLIRTTEARLTGLDDSAAPSEPVGPLELDRLSAAIEQLAEHPRREDLAEARRLDRVRQEFVANASHELLTPIGTVRALADALGRGGMDDRKAARRFLKQLRVEADRLTVLARDLVDLAQAQADELRLELKPTDAAEVITTVVERLHAPAAKAHVTLDILWDAQIPMVLADAARLEQVLLNLVQNAIKFTGPGGKVTIATETQGTAVLVRVSDTGVGIAADELPRIFERFYKVRSASGSAGGAGLGLAIVRHLVGAMQGEVTAESEVGQGSTFTVTLRCAETE